MEHGPEDVQSATGQGQHGLDLVFSSHTFVVVIPREAGQLSGQTAMRDRRPATASVKATRSMLVSGDGAGSPGATKDADAPIRRFGRLQGLCGGAEALGGENSPEAGIPARSARANVP